MRIALVAVDSLRVVEGLVCHINDFGEVSLSVSLLFISVVVRAFNHLVLVLLLTLELSRCTSSYSRLCYHLVNLR